MFPQVVASAPGFGPGLAEARLKLGASDELKVRLVEDGPPIEGRIVDLEGRPVAGARVKVERLWFPAGSKLSTVIKQNRDGVLRGPWDGLSPLPTTITTTTGPDGRFRLAGIGLERVAEFLVSGPTIATCHLYAMSWDGPETHCIDRWPEPRTIVFHAPRFEYAAAPIRPIVGVVRDKDTGRPIAGVKLRATVYKKGSGLNPPAPGVEATTDAQGRYRLSGLTKGSSYRVFVEPGEGLPYIKANLLASADSPGLEPVMFDIALKRGVVICGRVTDKATGQPVPGFVHAFTFYNPLVDEFPGYEGMPTYAYIKDDGRYETVAMPGRGIIACHSDSRRYRGGIGAEAIEGYDPKVQRFETRPAGFHVSNYHVLAEVNFEPRSESMTVDLQVDPGRTITLTTVDLEGKPIGETKVTGIGDLHRTTESEQASPTIEILALDPSKPRRVTITHVGRKLIGSVYLKGDETIPLTVRLQPWGTITGRIVDDDGQPRGGIGLWSAGGLEPPADQGILPGGDRGEGVWIGPDGRFRFERLVPGLKYGASAMDGVIMPIGELFQDVTVAPGEVKDLGDLKVIPPRRDGPL